MRIFTAFVGAIFFFAGAALFAYAMAVPFLYTMSSANAIQAIQVYATATYYAVLACGLLVMAAVCAIATYTQRAPA